MLQRIAVSDLHVGMYVARYGDGTWDAPMISSGLLIESRDQIEELASRGIATVFVDTERSWQQPSPPETANAQDQFDLRDIPPLVDLAKELPVAQRVYRHGLALARDIYDAVRRGTPFDPGEAAPVVDELLASLQRNAAASVAMTAIAPGEDYLLTHQVNVCILGLQFGRCLDLAEGQLRDLGLAGMLHDLGKALVPRELLERPGELSRAEFLRVQRHSQDGYQVLTKLGDLSETVLRGVLDHHERHDGSGYPFGLAGEDITLFPRLLGLVDMYDALTSRRPYAAARTPLDAFSLLYKRRSRDFQPGLLELFIKSLGIYPPGSLVRLSDGHVGVVERANPKAPLRPTVRVVLSRRLHPVRRMILDLAEERFRQGKEQLEVLDCLDPGAHRLDLTRLMG